jgi:hypothetical protein
LSRYTLANLGEDGIKYLHSQYPDRPFPTSALDPLAREGRPPPCTCRGDEPTH